MKGSRSRRALQALLFLLGIVAIVAGLATVLFGAASVVGHGDFTPSLDSEMRFYAVWYVIAGIVLLRSVWAIESQAGVVRAVGAGLFVAGCARGLSWIVVGRPHALAIVLMAIELTLPLVLVPWQSAVARRSA